MTGCGGGAELLLTAAAAAAAAAVSLTGVRQTLHRAAFCTASSADLSRATTNLSCQHRQINI